MLWKKAAMAVRRIFGITLMSGALVLSSFTGVMASELDESVEELVETNIDGASIKEETESNNDRASANAISFNEKYAGKIDTAADKDWFKVTIPEGSSGALSVTFWHGDCEENGTNGRWTFTLYSVDDQLYSKNVLGGSEASVTSDVFNLPAGNYYIEVKAFRSLGGLGWCSDDYTVTANFQSASGTYTETEFNDSSSTANVIDLNRAYNGRITNSGLVKDQDFFSFRLNAESEVSFTFWHENCAATELAAWDINLYTQSNGILVSKIKESVKGGEAATVTSKTEILPAGTYYVEVTSATVATSRNNLYSITVNSVVPSTVMYRLYNPNSGEHFWTGSEVEKNNLVKAGWTYEGLGWDAPTRTGDNVYRFYNAKLGDHHYTMRADEIAALNASPDWTNEGVCWNSYPGGRPMYRVYNPNAYSLGQSGAHHYTLSEAERNHLVSIGWVDEGIGWYSL